LDTNYFQEELFNLP